MNEHASTTNKVRLEGKRWMGIEMGKRTEGKGGLINK